MPVNTAVILYVNEPMNTSTISGALHISQNGVLVNGTTQVTDSGQVIQFTPSTPFQNNALVQVFLDSTALDTDGNSLTSYQGSFSTAEDTTTTGPFIVNTNPTNFSGIPTNVVMDLGFNETLNPSTVNTTTVSLMQGSTVIPSTVSLVGGGTIVQITPNSLLAANTAYTLQLTTGLQGTNGLPDTTDAPGTVLSFTTGAGTDTISPTVVLVSPPDGSTNVGDNANIRVRFSKAINPLTVTPSTIAISGGSVAQAPYAVSFTSNQEVLIAPYSPLPDVTQMSVAISGVTDVAGNTVVAKTTHFTTGMGPDGTIPLVVRANPFSGERNVPLNAPVVLQISEPVDPGTVSSSTFLVQDETTLQPVAGSYSVSADGQTISFVPNAPLAVGRFYLVSFVRRGITDLAGNLLTNSGSSVADYSFTAAPTANATPPQVVGVSPGSGLIGVPINAQVVIQFNEPVDAATLNQVTLGSGAAVTVTRTLSNGNQTLVLVPMAPLSPSTNYTVTIAGVQDVSGNSMAAPATSTFTTGTGADLAPPSVAGASPASGAPGVPTNSLIELRFSKRIDPLTVTTSTFQVIPANGLLIPGTIVVSTDGLTATFTPASPLATETTYTIDAFGMTDLEGQALQFFSSTFTTGLNPVTTARPY